MFWTGIDVIVVRVEVSRGIYLFSPMGIDSAGRALVNRSMGRLSWTNHIYFQVTQPGSSTVTFYIFVLISSSGVQAPGYEGAPRSFSCALFEGTVSRDGFGF